MRRCIVALIGAGMLALSLSACGDDEGRYGSVDDLREAVESAGEICTSYEVSDARLPPGEQQADCNEHTVLLIINDPADLKARAEFLNGLSLGLSRSVIVGDNWLVNTTGANGNAIHRALGGELTRTES